MKNKIILVIVFLLIPLVFADSCVDGQCYECDGEVVERDGKMVCLNCNEGFVLVDGSCQTIPQATYKPNFIDKFLYKYFPQNQTLGLLISIIVIFVLIYIIKNRKPLVRKFKNAIK